MPRLDLQITSIATGWRGEWSVDGRPIGEPIPVEVQAFRAMADLNARFTALFEPGGGRERNSRPFAEAEALRAMGGLLFATWFEPRRSLVLADLDDAGPHELLVRSPVSEALNLPWELVELAGGRPVGCDAAWSSFRSPLMKAPAPGGALRPGPLRVLFVAAAPIDQPLLDYEREEDAMLRATARLQNVVVHFAEAGSFDELKQLAAECRPHVVHLSGHGAVGPDGQGVFAFEDERGLADDRSADVIVSDVFRGPHGVRCVFLNGCQTSRAATAGLCQSLVAAGVPLAIGWSANVADDRATEFMEEFYKRLVHGKPAPIAATHAREVIRRKGLIRRGGVEFQDPTFALPQVFAPSCDGCAFDPDLPPIPYAGPRTEDTLLPGGIKGLTQGFIGRRREIQRLMPALREGKVTFAVMTGIGGAGKSTLATRAANRLESDGFRVVSVRVQNDDRGPKDAGRALLSRLIGALDDEFLRLDCQDLLGQLTNGNLPFPRRLRLAVKGLNELRLVVGRYEVCG